MVEEYLKRDCPSCYHHTNHALVLSSAPQAELLTLDKIKSYWSGFFKEKIFFSYHRCSSCGLMFCPAFFQEEQLKSLYKSMSDNTAGVAIEPLKKTQKGYFDFLKPHLPSQGGYLELGPDIGLFTEFCVNQDKFDQYWLFEPNKEVWPALQAKVKSHAHHLFDDLSALEAIPDQSISTCVMIHVLDHLLDPAALLKQLRKKLMPGAVLAFVTHDEQSLLAKLTKQKWPAFCLQHPQLYSKNTLTHFLKSIGFNSIECHKTYNYFPITYLLKHFLWLLGMRKVKLPELNWLYLGLKLGNIIAIARN